MSDITNKGGAKPDKSVGKGFGVDFTSKRSKRTNETNNTGTSHPVTKLIDQSAGETRHQEIVLSVDPKRCKMWAYADRDTAGLNESECADLITSFRNTERQELPAKARRLHDDPNFDFELIYGRRRRWACEFVGRRLDIKLTEDDDLACLIAMNAENKDRKDISAMERARSYDKQFNAKDKNDNPFYASEREMSRLLSIPNKTLSRSLKAGRLWRMDKARNLIGDLRKVSMVKAAELMILESENNERFTAVMDSIELADEYSKMSPNNVVDLMLQRMMEDKPSNKFMKDYDWKDGIIKVKTDANGDLTVKLPKEFLNEKKTSIGDFFLMIKSDMAV